MYRTNKHFGLKKLRKIAGADSRWFVSPHIVLTSPEQFRMAQTRGKARLLVRTDEAGKKYDYFMHDYMPRFEIPGPTLFGQIDNQKVRLASLGEREIQKRLAQAKEDANIQRYQGRLRYILHPTRKREDIAWTGRILIRQEREVTRDKRGFIQFPQIEISLTKSPKPYEKLHRNLPPTTEYKLTYKEGKFSPTTQNAPTKLQKEQQKQATQILTRLKALLKTGVESNQLKLGRTTQIHFISWKESPTTLELFDLEETRGATRVRVRRLN